METAPHFTPCPDCGTHGHVEVPAIGERSTEFGSKSAGRHAVEQGVVDGFFNQEEADAVLEQISQSSLPEEELEGDEDINDPLALLLMSLILGASHVREDSTEPIRPHPSEKAHLN